MSLLRDLDHCNREIEDRIQLLRSGAIDQDPPGAGILLGLHDWHRERELIMAEIESGEVKFAGGATSSPCPRYELIPIAATTALAKRFEYGIKRRGDGAWNALSANQQDAATKEFVLNRLGHCIAHCQAAIARIAGTLGALDADEEAGGGDAGAILFAGALLAEYEAKKPCPR